MKVLVAFCIAYEIDMPVVEVLLHSAGYALRLSDKVHFAYYFLLTDYSGRSIAECNELLEQLKIGKTDLLIENSK